MGEEQMGESYQLKKTCATLRRCRSTSRTCSRVAGDDPWTGGWRRGHCCRRRRRAVDDRLSSTVAAETMDKARGRRHGERGTAWTRPAQALPWVVGGVGVVRSGTTAIVVAVVVAAAMIATVVGAGVVIAVVGVVVTARCARGGALLVAGLLTMSGGEGLSSLGGSVVLDADLLEHEDGAHTHEGVRRVLGGDDRLDVAVLGVEPAEEVEHLAWLGDGVTDVGELICKALELGAVIIHGAAQLRGR